MKKWKDGMVPSALDLPGRSITEIDEIEPRWQFWLGRLLMLSYPLIALGTVIYWGVYVPLKGWFA